MYCTKCGATMNEDGRFCGKCGEEFKTTTRSITPMPNISALAPISAQDDAEQVRPWVRYWARMFDISLFCIVAGITIGIFAPDALNEKGSDRVFGFVCVFGWVFIEALLLSTIGTTPGKWFFKTQLVPPGGTKATYSCALSRSFKVWWRGLGIGFPLASLITLIVAHRNLKKNGITSWDRDYGFSVIHHRIGPLRIIVSTLLFLGFLALIVVGSMANS